VPLLFSYGTLQQDDVQLATFGRLLHGRQDALAGFEPSLVAIEDPDQAAALRRSHHANVTRCGDPGSRVNGMVFEVTDAELAASDEYERPARYERISATLVSGLEAWLYVAESNHA
jgi:hypothetical protein